MKVTSPKLLLYSLFGLGLGLFEAVLVAGLLAHAKGGFNVGYAFLLLMALIQLLIGLVGFGLAFKKPRE